MKLSPRLSRRPAAAITRHAPRPPAAVLARRTGTTRQCNRADRGIAMVIVMISILVLTTLAAGFAYSMKVETKLARNANSEAELEWLGRSGVEYARWVLANSMMDPTQPYDSLDQPWATGSGWLGPTNAPIAEVQQNVHLGAGTFNWKIVDLERKFNINSPEPVLEQVLPQALTLMGVSAGEATPIVNSILDWTDVDGHTRPEGAETDYYQNLRPSYAAKDGPIDDLSELLLIKGVIPELYWGTSSSDHPPGIFQPLNSRSHLPSEAISFPVGLVELFTPLSDGKININTASAAVLQLIPGVDPLAAEAIVGGRSGQADPGMPGMMGPYRSVGEVARVPELPRGGPLINMLNQYCDTRSRTFQVQVDADVGGYKRTFYAVLGRTGPRDVQILTFYWK